MTRLTASALLFATLAAAGTACNRSVRSATPGPHSVPSVDGVPITYQVAGTGPTTLVFIHGWSCDRTYWREQMGAFAASYRVVALDLAGHGESGSGRTAWSIQNFANDVAAVVKDVDARRVVLIGHSLGGPVALEAGLLLPDRVTGVIGVEAFFDFWADSAATHVFDGLRKDFAAQTRAFVRKAMFTATSPAPLADSIADAMAAARPEIALPALDSLLSWARVRPATAVPALKAPLGLIMAPGGRRATIEFQRLRGSAPTLGIEEIPGVGHFLMREAPAAFNDRLRTMLNRIDSDRSRRP